MATGASVAAGSRVSPVLSPRWAGSRARQRPTTPSRQPPREARPRSADRRGGGGAAGDGGRGGDTASFLADVPGGEVFARTGAAEFGAGEVAGAGPLREESARRAEPVAGAAAALSRLLAPPSRSAGGQRRRRARTWARSSRWTTARGCWSNPSTSWWLDLPMISGISAAP